MLKLRRGAVWAAGVVEGARLCAYERWLALDPPMGSGAAHRPRAAARSSRTVLLAASTHAARRLCTGASADAGTTAVCRTCVSGHGRASSTSTIQKAFCREWKRFNLKQAADAE